MDYGVFDNSSGGSVAYLLIDSAANMLLHFLFFQKFIGIYEEWYYHEFNVAFIVLSSLYYWAQICTTLFVVFKFLSRANRN